MGVQAGALQQVIHGGGDRKDAILPNLEVLRRNDTVPNSVNQLLASYEQKGRQEVIQGRGLPLRNLEDIVQLRWSRHLTILTILTAPQIPA